MGKVIREILVALVRIYQLTIAKLLGQRCRFYPSCSQYMIDAIRNKGAIRGVWMGIVRIFKCHPFHPGGYDPAR